MANNTGVKPAGSGRQKGTRNRRNVDVRDKLLKLGCDPLAGLARIAQAAENEGDKALAATCLRDLAKYCHPQLKAMEVSGPEAGAVCVEISMVGAGPEAGNDVVVPPE